jgi:hypothetical protein
MADEVAAWPRPYFQASDQRTKVFFVCFAKAPLAHVELSRKRFGVPSEELSLKVDVREHQRTAVQPWFENWWGGPFGVMAEQDLGQNLAELMDSDVCYTLALDLEDQPDLMPLQTVWGLSRWLCARGASVVLDVHAFRFRTRAQVDALAFDAGDVERDVKLVFEKSPTRDGLHLLHTRGLCKLARPELLSFIQVDDLGVMGNALNQLAQLLMLGAAVDQARVRVTPNVELTLVPSQEQSLIDSLGLEAAVDVARSDGAPLAGIGGLVPKP